MYNYIRQKRSDMDIKTIKKLLKDELKKDRYKHTINVSYTAMCLAMRYEEDLEKAMLAGLLHDCAKCISDDAQLKKCISKGIDVNETEKRQPYLLHAKLGAYLAKEKYGVKDKEVLSAIRKHTTGDVDMTMLEKIIFVADYIEPARSKAKNLTLIRRLAFEDIDTAVYFIMKDTLEYLEEKGSEIDKQTKKAYEFYKNMYAEKGGNNK